MSSLSKLRYKGYLNTPKLWDSGILQQFEQVELSNDFKIIDEFNTLKNKRLGKLVEEFAFYQLKLQDSITWIESNLQIRNNKQTIGEIDALYSDNGQPIHLEVVYKFYLYDTLKDYDSPLEYWIGPNRKDSLSYKLNKLMDKQFPLLYKRSTRSYLEKYNIKENEILQRLYFKGQLFLPYYNLDIDVSPLNKDCISGLYISFNDIKTLKPFKLYIPTKLDWLIKPYEGVNWLSFKSALQKIELDIFKKHSPLVWLMNDEGKMKKCFITFW